MQRGKGGEGPMENIVGEERHLIAYQKMKNKWYGCLIHNPQRDTKSLGARDEAFVKKNNTFQKEGRRGWMRYKCTCHIPEERKEV